MGYLKTDFQRSRSSLFRLFNEITTTASSDMGDADAAFLQAVAFHEWNYFGKRRLQVDEDKLLQGLSFLEKFERVSLAVTDSKMIRFFSLKCSLDRLHFKSEPFRVQLPRK